MPLAELWLDEAEMEKLQLYYIARVTKIGFCFVLYSPWKKKMFSPEI